MITIDGSVGGGQLLRTALALSAITKTPFSMRNIRAGRKDPGIKAQHLLCINAIKEITGATCDAKLGDTEITFIPGTLRSVTDTTLDVGTAGSVTLVLQCLLPTLISSRKRSHLFIKGGTDVAWSPSIDYVRETILPALKPYADINISIQKRGFYPKGGGEIELSLKPAKKIVPLDKTSKGRLLHITGTVLASMHHGEQDIVERMKKIEQMTLSKTNTSVRIQDAHANTPSLGIVTTLAAAYEHTVIGADKLWDKDQNPDELAESCAKLLLSRMKSEAACDEHLADHLIPYLGLFGGALTTTHKTEHLITNIDITNLFLENKEIIVEEKEQLLHIYTKEKEKKE